MKVELHVEWGWTDACAHPGRVTSLSVGGCFIQTGLGGPRGQAVFVCLWLSPDGTSHVRGRVVYHLEKVGLGVEFEGLGAEEAGHIQDIIDYYRVAAPTGK